VSEENAQRRGRGAHDAELELQLGPDDEVEDVVAHVGLVACDFMDELACVVIRIEVAGATYLLDSTCAHH